jgi:hypothetical protein
VDSVAYIHQGQATDRFERVSLGRREGRRTVEVLLPGLLLKGQSHLFYGASDTGKSWLAQYAARETMREGLPVLYFDLENLADVMEVRMLDTLEVLQEHLDDYFHYYPSVDLTLDHESKGWFTTLLDSFGEPGLVAWDSLLGFLSLAGLKEDASDDFEQWARFYLDQARYRGWTSMVLDHTGHNGSHARGTSRKGQTVQVVYKVEKPQPFDRTAAGRQKLTREKDRLAYLPKIVETTLGGTPFGFGLKYDGQEFLNNSQHTALHVLAGYQDGATHGEWKTACTPDKMSVSTFNRAVGELAEKGYAELGEDKRYRHTCKGQGKVS